MHPTSQTWATQVIDVNYSHTARPPIIQVSEDMAHRYAVKYNTRTKAEVLVLLDGHPVDNYVDGRSQGGASEVIDVERLPDDLLQLEGAPI